MSFSRRSLSAAATAMSMFVSWSATCTVLKPKDRSVAGDPRTNPRSCSSPTLLTWAGRYSAIDWIPAYEVELMIFSLPREGWRGDTEGYVGGLGGGGVGRRE